jgi:hypothetical protein
MLGRIASRVRVFAERQTSSTAEQRGERGRPASPRVLRVSSRLFAGRSFASLDGGRGNAGGTPNRPRFRLTAEEMNENKKGEEHG